MRPRLLMVGRTRYTLPLDAPTRRKFDALAEVLDVHVLASSETRATRDERFTLVPPFPVRRLDGLAFHALLPFRVARALRAHAPDVVLVQGAHEAAATLAGRALARTRARVVLDVHGDWRTATRVYGSPLRRLLNPVADRVASWAVRRVDAIRTVSEFTSALVREQGREPLATFPAFMDLEPFLEPPRPLPDEPAALFVGTLELYKGIDVLAEAWPRVAARVPRASLHVVGKGARSDVVARLVERGPRVTWAKSLTGSQVAAALDEAVCLVLPSRREGMGRVVVEALLRARPVVGSDSGGIRDLVVHERTALLVPEGDARALEDALVRVLGDRATAERLAAPARARGERLVATPDEYAERVCELVAAARA